MRFDSGPGAWERLAVADICVIIDVFGATAHALKGLDDSERLPLRALGDEAVLDVLRSVARSGTTVFLGGLRNPSAVAEAVVGEQEASGRRAAVAVIAIGHRGAPAGVQDVFGAGAVVDALVARGIDHTSPEAMVPAEAFRGLRPALRHLLTASVDGQVLIDRGERDAVRVAAEVDATATVPIVDGAHVRRR